jgi:parvulin-like peptidyl-prolyl isomerase
MKRIVVVVAVLSIVAAACAGSDDVVASVNGLDIMRSQVEVLEPESNDNSIEADFTRFLSVIVTWSAISQAAADEYGIEPTDEEIDARLDELVAGQGTGATLEEYLRQVDASEEGIRQFANQLIIQDAIQAELTDPTAIAQDVISNELLNNRLAWTVVCVSHILVATQDEAVAVITRLEAGEEFSDVATEVSTDTGTGPGGGDLGCSSPTNYVETFASATMEAEIGVVTAPVESEFGYHVILVSQREEATSEVVRETLEQNALVDAVDAWFVAVVADAVVVIDDTIGVWVIEPSPQVVGVN